MRIVLLGAPGAGKGTQAELLVKTFGVLHLTTGDLLRQAVEDVTVLGKQAKPILDAGQTVPDDIVVGLVRERLSLPDIKQGFVLEGFPRTMSQAEQFDQLLAELRLPLQGAIMLEVDVDALIQRLTGRRTCLSCGETYNMYTDPPRFEGRCNECGGKLRRRPEDNEETIGNRLRLFESQFEALNVYYDESKRLKVINGIGEVRDIFSAVKTQLKTLPSEESLLAELDTGDGISFDDLERKVLETMQRAVATANKEVIEPADQALLKAEAIVRKEVGDVSKKVIDAAKHEAEVLSDEAKELGAKLSKSAKHEMDVLSKEAKVIGDKVTKATKEAQKKLVKVAKKEAKELTKEAKSLKKKVSKAVKKAVKTATKESNALKKKVTKAAKDLQKRAAPVKKKVAAKKAASKKTASKKTAKKTAAKKTVSKKKVASKKVASKKKAVAKKAATKKKVAKKKVTKKKVAKKTTKKKR